MLSSNVWQLYSACNSVPRRHFTIMIALVPERVAGIGDEDTGNLELERVRVYQLLKGFERGGQNGPATNNHAVDVEEDPEVWFCATDTPS